MGNKLCKRKADEGTTTKSPKAFDKIIDRLHLRPNSWRSDSHLNDKKQVNSKNKSQNNIQNESLSKSSDWTEVELEVPEKEEGITLKNAKLVFNDDGTPTPPPRKHRHVLRDKLEAVAKNGLQAFRKPVEEPVCVKKTVNPTCPVDEHDCAVHNRDHRHERPPPVSTPKLSHKEAKRRKNLSVVSLPNYDELKLTVAHFDDIDRPEVHRNSLVSLTNEPAKKLASTGKLELYMTRCRSFGSLLPQQLRGKLKVRKAASDNESEDSFSALEDWDLKVIEHFDPKEASLPRRRTTKKSDKDVLAGIENLIVKDEEIAQNNVNKTQFSDKIKDVSKKEMSQSLSNSAPEKARVKKPSPDTHSNSISAVTKNADETVIEKVSQSQDDKEQMDSVSSLSKSTPIKADRSDSRKSVGHSGLMKFLQMYGKDSEERLDEVSSVSDDFKTSGNVIEDFINAERNCGIVQNKYVVKA